MNDLKSPRGNVAGRYVVIPLVILGVLVGVGLLIVRHQGEGAIETNRLLLSYMQGLRDIDDGYYHSAVENLTPVIEARWRPDAWGFRGEAYLRQEKFQRAESDFRQAVKREPNMAVNHAGLAAALAGQGGYSSALKEIDKAISLFPENQADAKQKTVPRTGDSLEQLKSLRSDWEARLAKKS